MIFGSLIVGILNTNCYLLGCSQTGQAVVVDPGFEGEKIIREIRRLELQVKYIVNTHGHIDHISANSKLKEATGGLICLHERDLPLYLNPSFGISVAAEKQPDPDRLVAEGDRIVFGQAELEVLETPGHTEGGISLLGSGLVFTGDTLFAGSVGRTDLPGGNWEQLLQSIRRKLMVLPEQTRVYPGHGPDSTIIREKKANPFLKE